MDFRILESDESSALWPQVVQHFPDVERWKEEPRDDSGSYRCFAAVGSGEELLGLGIIDIGALAFGPLADRTIGFLEDIRVLEPHRRQGIGKALLRHVLSFAWQRGAENVRWDLDYDNAAGIALSCAVGAAFVPEEDPEAEHPDKCYTVVAVNPKMILQD
jgi:GNAT superfamily N-acetyltransferase